MDRSFQRQFTKNYHHSQRAWTPFESMQYWRLKAMWPGKKWHQLAGNWLTSNGSTPSWENRLFRILFVVSTCPTIFNWYLSWQFFQICDLTNFVDFINCVCLVFYVIKHIVRSKTWRAEWKILNAKTKHPGSRGRCQTTFRALLGISFSKALNPYWCWGLIQVPYLQPCVKVSTTLL